MRLCFVLFCKRFRKVERYIEKSVPTTLRVVGTIVRLVRFCCPWR